MIVEEKPVKVPKPPKGLHVFEPAEPLSHELVLAGEHGARIETLALELSLVDRWLRDGIDPPARVLFHGPTGTGKTLTTRWLARRLRLPCAVVDLSGLISQYMGESPKNVSAVFDYAEQREVLLLLDEVDTITGHREELKGGGADKERALVTATFFQRLDALPPGRIVIAATNYEEHLDPALYRRFPERLEFVAPSDVERRRILEGILHGAKIPAEWKTSIVDRLLADPEAAELGGAELRAHAMRLVRRMVGTPAPSPDAPAAPASRVDRRKLAAENSAQCQGILRMLEGGGANATTT